MVCMRWRATASSGRFQRNLHAYRTQDGAQRHGMACHAVLAQIVLVRQRGPNDPEGLLAIRGAFDRGILLTRCKNLAFQSIVFAFLPNPGAKLPGHRLAAQDPDLANAWQLLDLVNEHLALWNRAGDHHSGQPGEHHVVGTPREILRLFDCCLFTDVRGPQDHHGPGRNNVR
jgi:hypothetical protein